jgi:hypothetical protein
MAGADWLSAVDFYLYSVARIGAEETLAEGCVSGRVPAAVAACVTIERELAHRMVESDGGTSEVYRGALTVTGVRYSFECRLFIDSDGSHFVVDVSRFEPVEWSTAVQVA